MCEPWTPIQGHCVPLGLCVYRGSSPALGGAPMAWFWLFYYATPTQSNNRCLLLIATAIALRYIVGNNDSFVNPTALSVGWHGLPLIGRPTMSLKWRLSSAPSNLRPDSTEPTRGKQKLTYQYMIALICQTISSDHILTNNISYIILLSHCHRPRPRWSRRPIPPGSGCHATAHI